MLFASTELAARIERAEVDLVRSAVDAVVSAGTAADAMVRSLAGGAALYSSAGSPLNKVVGLGFEGAVNEDELHAIEREYAARGAPVQVELSTLANPAIGTLLTTRGYRLVGFENVLGRDLSGGTPPGPSMPGSGVIAVEEASDFEAWLDAVVTGFATPDRVGVPSHESLPREVLESVMREMAGAVGLTRYLARLDGMVAGGASMRTGDGIAQMCGAATLPAFRRRGVQAALLEHRLAEAMTAGCDLAVVTTQPGSTSQKNMQRNGFDLLYTRAVLVLAPSG